MAAILSSASDPSGRRGAIRPHHPDADAVLAPFAAHVEGGERADDPLFKCRDEGADILAPPLQVEHHISDPLAWPMIGVFAAAPGGEHREAVGLDQVLDAGAGAGGVERRVLDQPDHLAGGAASDRFGTRLHHGKRIRIGGEAGFDPPFDRRRTGQGQERRGDLAAFCHGMSRLKRAAFERNRGHALDFCFRHAAPKPLRTLGSSPRACFWATCIRPHIWRQSAETSSCERIFSSLEGYAEARAIIARRALVSPETICYTPRAGSFRLLPRAVVAELVDAQR